MSKLKIISDLDCSHKRVLVRVDFNVPFDKDGKISDDTRIRAAIPTIKYLLEQKAKIILMSHLGRPKGELNLKYSLRPVADELCEILDMPVDFCPECVGDEAEEAVSMLPPGSILLLENLRFHKEEEGNDPEFAKALALLGEVYINDAFGTAHRAHASTAGVAGILKSKGIGLLMQKELQFLGEKTENPARPFVVILGGAKVSDKIQVIDALLEKADTMIIGGAMAYTFAMAQGHTVGKSLVEVDKVDLAKACLEKAAHMGVNIFLPVDSLVTDKLDFVLRTLGKTHLVGQDIPGDLQGIDIGPKSVELFTKAINGAKTILWNGPMGVFEIEESARGTFAIAEAVAKSGSVSIIGGGDSVKAIKSSGFADKVSFISTGGGASLEFLEGKKLPGLVALEE